MSGGTGGSKRETTRAEWLALLGFIAVVFAMLAIWTAPLPVSSKAGLTSLVFVAACLIVAAAGRR